MTVFKRFATLFLCVAASAPALAQDQFNKPLFSCSVALGELKTGCRLVKDAIAVGPSTYNSDFVITYSFTCPKEFFKEWGFTTDVAETTSYAHPNPTDPGKASIMTIREGQKLFLRAFPEVATQAGGANRSFVSAQFHKSCELIVHSVDLLPAQSTINLWKNQADAFVKQINSQFQSWLEAEDYAWVVTFTDTGLQTLKEAAGKIASELLGLAGSTASTDCDPDFEECSAPKTLDELFYTAEDKAVVKGQTIVYNVLKVKCLTLTIDCQEPMPDWYKNLPTSKLQVAGPNLGLYVQIANVQTRKALGLGPVTSEKESQAEKNLRETLSAARAFLNDKAQWQDKFQELFNRLKNQTDNTENCVTKGACK